MWFASLFSSINQLFESNRTVAKGSLYDFKINSLTGQPIDFNKYKGKKLLIVNTASKCGFTGQLEDLQKMHELHPNKVSVIGFPANDFLWQEPGTNEDIAEFCSINYGVSFQMFEKISVSGKSIHPLYQWLKAKSGKAVSWNFCKYLIDEKGNIEGFFPPKVKPFDKQITDKILA